MAGIELATTDAQIQATYGIMKQLRPHVPESDYVRLVKMQQSEQGYRLAALAEAGQTTCVAGFRIGHSLAWGRHMYVDDLVTDEVSRSRGAGKAMLDWLVEYARAERCGELHLDSGVQRHEAHRFYLRERMDIVFYHFRMSL
jgi:GNAT superfamily N-acetyltransferase